MDAEEIVQDILINVWMRRSELKNIENLNHGYTVLREIKRDRLYKEGG